MAAGPFTREAIAVVKNQQFIDWCKAMVIKPLQTCTITSFSQMKPTITGLAVTCCCVWRPPRKLKSATQAATRTLELAEELQHLALTKMGVHHAPGC